MDSTDILRNQEMYRARSIVLVAERDGLNVSATLRQYGVASSIIEEFGLEIVPITPKEKNKKNKRQQTLLDWAKNNVGREINGGRHISEDTGLSYSFTNKFVQERRDIFTKVKKGKYVVNQIDESRLV